MLCLAGVPAGAGVNMSAGESGDPGDGTGFMSAGGSTFATDQPPWAVRAVQPGPDADSPPRFLLVPVPAGNGTVVFIVIDL